MKLIRYAILAAVLAGGGYALGLFGSPTNWVACRMGLQALPGGAPEYGAMHIYSGVRMTTDGWACMSFGDGPGVDYRVQWAGGPHFLTSSWIAYQEEGAS